jgi:hypothetical protein
MNAIKYFSSYISDFFRKIEHVDISNEEFILIDDPNTDQTLKEFLKNPPIVHKKDSDSDSDSETYFDKKTMSRKVYNQKKKKKKCKNNN